MPDEYGYPTEEELERIESWDPQDVEGCLRFIGELWHWQDWWGEKDGLWVFATGGWSGNESLLHALKRSLVGHVIHGSSLSLPGGLLIIATGKKARKKLELVFDKIRGWAWSHVETVCRTCKFWEREENGRGYCRMSEAFTYSHQSCEYYEPCEEF